MQDTIFALATPGLPAAVAVIRISGPACRFVLETMSPPVPPDRRAVVRALRDPRSGERLDEALVIRMDGPGSFTGEDVAEFHVHGSRAVVAAVLGALGGLPGLRPAEAGEFTHRAMLAGRLDLTEVEGLGDLIRSETEGQRRQALAQAGGLLRRAGEAWREGIVTLRALVEAELDFSEEEDVPGESSQRVAASARDLAADIRSALGGLTVAERIRDGYRVVVAGPPNAGKSTLVNLLAGRDVAIVTDRPGTTRDVLEVRLDLGGMAVLVSDVAGWRQTEDEIEAEGIRRALDRARSADLVLWLDPQGAPPPPEMSAGGARVHSIRSRYDRLGPAVAPQCDDGLPRTVSAHSGHGIDVLVDGMTRLATAGLGREPLLVVHERQRAILADVAANLEEAGRGGPGEMMAESLRRAADGLGRLTGRMDVEDVLGAIFSRFCIGK